MRNVLLACIFVAVGSRLCFPQPAAPLLTIPLEPYLRAQAVVRGVVNGEPGTFLFDTGVGVSNLTPRFVKKIGCEPWGRITGFRMTGERLDNQHCDGIGVELSGLHLVAPVVSTVDIMALMGPNVPQVDGAFGLDLFVGRAITIIPRRSIIVESAASLGERIANAQELPIRLVRDVQGIALTVVGAVRTPSGTAWMELDNGNGGSMVVANHIAPLFGLKPDVSTAEPARFYLGNGIAVQGLTRTRDLIMDGNISAQFLNNWILTLDLQRQRAWMSPLPTATK